MRVIVVAGMPGAGKEEFLTVARGMGLPFLRMCDIVREFFAACGPEDSGMTVGQFASAERDRKGTDIWAKRALERMSGDIFLIDGCRSMDEVTAYRRLTPDVRIVAVHSCPDTRYGRLVERARDDAPRNIGEFRARDGREIGWGLAETIALSDVMIVNECSLDEFHARSAEVLRGLRD
jgi:dephospho-CoA kinase